MESDAPQIVFAGGGTGGHLFPALAVADVLRARHRTASIWFIGARRGMEQRLVPAAGYELRSLRLSGIKGRGLVQRVLSAAAAGWAVARCLAWLALARPDLVIGVGGYASGPAVLAATLLRLKTMVLEQNHFPGATNRWLAPRVDEVCVPSAAARERLGGRGVITGNPVRAGFAEIGEPPLERLRSILVFGGSRGAHSINLAMSRAVKLLSGLDPAPRICVQTGADDEAWVRDAWESYPEDRREVLPFIEDMPARLAPADLVICRAGASTLSELCVAGRGAILVPYPHAADDHQRHNAETMRDAGAALVVGDAELEDRLADCIVELCTDAERLRGMGRAARRLGRPDASERIADVAEGLLTRGGALRGADVS